MPGRRRMMDWNNPEDVKQYKARYYQEHKQKYKARADRYRREHKDQVKQYRDARKAERKVWAKAYWENNRDRLIAERNRRYYERKEELNARARERYRTDAAYRQKVLAACKRYKARLDPQELARRKRRWYDKAKSYLRTEYASKYRERRTELARIRRAKIAADSALLEAFRAKARRWWRRRRANETPEQRAARLADRKQYRAAHAARLKQYFKQYHQTRADQLTDGYIKALLRMPHAPADLIEAKRALVRVKRVLTA